MGELERYGLLALLAVTVLAVGFLLEEVRVLQGPEQVFELKAQREADLAEVLRDELGARGESERPGGGKALAAERLAAAEEPPLRVGFDFFEPPAELPGLDREYPEPPSESEEAGTSGGPRQVQIRKDDTLEKIARRELGSGTRWREILVLNPGIDPQRMQRGDWLNLPARERPVEPPATPPAAGERTYLVRNGDNFESIAQRVYSDRQRWMAIFEANRDVCSSPEKLRAGIRIVIP